MKVHKKIGSKERLFEMFKNVNKLDVINENKIEKKIIEEGYTEFGHKIKKSRINEAIDPNDYPGGYDSQEGNFDDEGDPMERERRMVQQYNDEVYDEEFPEEFDDTLPFPKPNVSSEKANFSTQNPPMDDTLPLPKPNVSSEKANFRNEADGDMEGYDLVGRKLKLEDALNLADNVYNMEGNENDFLTKYISDKSLTLKSLKEIINKYIQSGRIAPDTDNYFKLENLISILNDQFDQTYDWRTDPKAQINRPNVINKPVGGFGEGEEIPSPEEAGIEPEINNAEPEVPVEPENIETDMVDDIPEPGAGEEEAIEGGLADGAEPSQFSSEQIIKGMEVEMEHSDDPKVALEIAMDHLTEIPDYYDHLENMEANAQGAEEIVPDMGDEATPEDAIDALGDGANTAPADDDSPSEDEVLWGRMDSISDEPDEVDDYEPKGLGEYNDFQEEEFVAHGTYTVSNAGGYEIMLDDSGDAAKVRDAYGSDNPQTSDWLEIEHVPSEDNGEEFEAVIDPNGYNIPLNQVMRVNR